MRKGINPVGNFIYSDYSARLVLPDVGRVNLYATARNLPEKGGIKPYFEIRKGKKSLGTLHPTNEGGYRAAIPCGQKFNFKGSDKFMLTDVEAGAKGLAKKGISLKCILKDFVTCLEKIR